MYLLLQFVLLSYLHLVLASVIMFEILLRQIERDCEFLEAERIMDYSLLVGLHFRDDNTCDKMGLSPFLLRTGNQLHHPSIRNNSWVDLYVRTIRILN
jgi:hypothetical protein